MIVIGLGFSRMKPDRAIHNLATLINLAIEVECDACHKRFTEPEGETEADIWQWAQKAAAGAYQDGWREFTGRLLCLECVSHTTLDSPSSRPTLPP